MAIEDDDQPTLPAISSAESLLRRVPPSWYPDPKAPDRPTFDVFLPRRWQSDDDPGDSTGLSVNREAFTTIDRVARHPDTGARQSVLRTWVDRIATIGLTAAADPLPGDPSHALIPELNSVEYRNPEHKRWIKSAARRLARDHCEMASVVPR